jgi:excisionase family DNA binding protein
MDSFTHFHFSILFCRSKNSPIAMRITCEYLRAMAEEWMTASDAASYLKTERRSLLRLVREGKVPACKLSGTKRHVYRFLARDLDAAIMGQAVTE